MEYVVDHVMIAPTMRCNYRCKHCGWSCEPGTGDDIPIENVKEYINQLPELKTEKFGITGGEPTLYGELDEIILHAGNVRCRTGYPKLIYMNTNASWIEDETSASMKLKEWRRLGLDELRPSYDEYHREFTPDSKIQILRGLTRIDNMPEICILEEIGFIPVGRALSNVPRKKWLDPPYDCKISGMMLRDSFPEYDERFLEIFPDGVYVCDFRVGRLGHGRISDLVVKAMENPILKIISELSVKRTLELIQDKIPSDMQMKARTLHECTLCYEVFQDEKILGVIESESAQLLDHVERLNEELKRQIEEARAYDAKPMEEKIAHLKSLGIDISIAIEKVNRNQI
jgi:hypothetical protein